MVLDVLHEALNHTTVEHGLMTSNSCDIQNGDRNELLTKDLANALQPVNMYIGNDYLFYGCWQRLTTR